MQTSAWILNIQLILLLYFFALNEFLGKHLYFLYTYGIFFCITAQRDVWQNKINDKIFLRCSAYVCLMIRININRLSPPPYRIGISSGGLYVNRGLLLAFFMPACYIIDSLCKPWGWGGGGRVARWGSTLCHAVLWIQVRCYSLASWILFWFRFRIWIIFGIRVYQKCDKFQKKVKKFITFYNIYNI